MGFDKKWKEKCSENIKNSQRVLVFIDYQVGEPHD